MLQSITDTLLQILDSIGYLGIFIATAIESFFAPIPSEVILITAGLYAKANGGILEIGVLSIIAALGSWIGTLPFYLISLYGADHFLPKFIKRWGKFLLISHKDIKNGEKLFAKYGGLTVFLSRLIPGIRSIIAFPAGIAKMHFGKYTFYTLLGSFIWNVLLISIGYIAYDSKDALFAFLKPIEILVVILLLLLFAVYIAKVIHNYQVHTTD